MEETNEKEGMGDDVEQVHAVGYIGVCWWRGMGGFAGRVVWL